MKRWLTILGVCALGAAAIALPFAFKFGQTTPPPPSVTPNAFWRMDETNGTRDDSIGTNDLAETGVITSAAGIINLASDFAGGAFLTVTNPGFLATDSANGFTLWFWFYTPNNDEVLAETVDSGGNRRVYCHFSPDFGNNFYLVIYDDMGGAGDLHAGSSLPFDTWIFVALVFNPSPNPDETDVYVDGVYMGTVAYDLGLSTTETLHFGGGSGPSLNGRIDAAGWATNILTATQITNLYNGGVGVQF